MLNVHNSLPRVSILFYLTNDKKKYVQSVHTNRLKAEEELKRLNATLPVFNVMYYYMSDFTVWE